MKYFNSKKYCEDLERIVNGLPDKEMSFLITGATGLIGSYIIDVLTYANRFKMRNYKIYAMGRSIKRLNERFGYVDIQDNLILVEQDVCNEFPSDLKVDYIIHAASNADPRSYALYPVETILTNIEGTKNALDYAKAHENVRVLFTSTMEVYGNIEEKWSFEEKDFGSINFNEVRSGYPESKRTAELLCRSYVAQYEVDAVIARMGYIYGPTMSKTDNKVIAQFIRNILHGEDIILKSKGEQKRSYCYVADAVLGIFLILFHGLKGEAYNVASPNSVTSIFEMANIAAKLCDKKIIFDLPDELEIKGFSKPQDNVLDTSKIEDLGWDSEYDLESGMRKTVQIMQEMKL